jgi:hypothetical protein
MAFTRNSFKILAKGAKIGLSPFLTIFRCRVKFRNCSSAPSLNLEKGGSDPLHFRSTSLLSIVFSIFERMILQRIVPLIDAVVRVSQAGFRKNRSCTEQVLALTSHIAALFQSKLKTGVVFIDLTAAYDTVWRDSLMLKFIRVVSYAKLSNLLNNMLLNRFFQVFLDDIEVYGVESIMDYLKVVFWRGCRSVCT